MEEDKTKKIDNTIKAVYEVLEKNKDNSKVKEAYDNAKKLTKKRGIL